MFSLVFNYSRPGSSMLNQERLKELLHYDPKTGIFTNKRGKQAGTINKKGYRYIKIDYKTYLEHRLAWFYIYDIWPANFIDHIDCNPCNNRINNLQDITNQQNLQRVNKPRKNNSSGYRGVHWNKQNNKFKAKITINYKAIHLGYFDTALEAHKAYQAAKLTHHFKELQ